MAQQLPNGFVDTGVTKDFTVSCTMKVRYLTGVSAGDFDPTAGGLNHLMSGQPDSFWVYADAATLGIVGGESLFHARIAGGIGRVADPFAKQKVVYLIAKWLPSPFYVELENVYPAALHDDSDVYDFEATITNFRLGVKIEEIDTPDYPDFWTNHRLKYQWFLDGDSTLSITCAGQSSGTLYWKGSFGSWLSTQDATQTPTAIGNSAGRITVHGHTTDGSAVQVEHRSITSDGAAMDTAEIHDWETYGYSAGSGGMDTQGPINASADAGMYAPWRFHYNLNVTAVDDHDLSARIADQYIVPTQTYTPDSSAKTPQADYLTTHHDDTYVVQITDHERRTKNFTGLAGFDLDNAWANSQSPAIRSDDRRCPINGAPARNNPAGSAGEPGTYTPIDVTLQNNLDVLLSTNVWSASGGELVRNLKSFWRSKLSASSPEYEVCKANWAPWSLAETEDRWFWGAYGHASIRITAPVGSDLSLNLVVTGVHLEVSDNHETVRSISHTEHAFSYSYPISVPNGATTTIPIDLAKLVGSRWCFPSRVDQVKLTGTGATSVTVVWLRLVTILNGYLKNDFGPPVQRQDYSAIWVDQDGASGTSFWGDQDTKPDETGQTTNDQYGGGIRYVELLRGTVTGIIQDSIYALSTFWGKLNFIEGYSVVFTQATEDTANKDSFGNIMGSNAQWSHPIVPHARLTPGAAYQPPCSPRIRNVAIVNGLEILLRVNWPIWGQITALLISGGGRAAGGTTATVYRVDTSAAVETDAADAEGFVVVTPIPADGTREYRLSLSSSDPLVALRPHDRVRLANRGTTSGRRPANFVDDDGRYYTACVDAGSIIVKAADFAQLPFVREATISGGGNDNDPDLYEDADERIVLLFARGSSPSIYEARSDDAGATWSTAAMAFTGGKYARGVLDPMSHLEVQVAYVGGVLRGRKREGGEASWSSEYNLLTDLGGTIATEDDTFDLYWADDLNGNLSLVVHISGETQISHWLSHDGVTFKRQ